MVRSNTREKIGLDYVEARFRNFIEDFRIFRDFDNTSCDVSFIKSQSNLRGHSPQITKIR